MSDETLTVLERRCFAVPDLVRDLDLQSLEEAATILEHATSVICTGIGASEGPARLLATLLPSARFVPLSAFLLGDHRTVNSPGAVLVLFSQGLSPNARIALHAADSFSRTIVICSVDRSLDERLRALPASVTIVRHEPQHESGFLVRVTGPAVASAVAMSLAALVTTGQTRTQVEQRRQECAEAMHERLRRPTEHVDLRQSPPAFLVSGIDGAERAHLLRWTLLECPDLTDPPVWDLLSFAHGPYQNIFEKPHTVFIPYSNNDLAISSLVDRLLEMLKPTQHLVVKMASVLPRPWAQLDHLAAIQRLALDHVTKYSRDLRKWPGQGLDGPLYDLDNTLDR